jgi:acetyl-CoA carboxylase biotin carboxylase subunit
MEFLVDADQNFYFLEMNTRLQVEHPVTEAVTGIDLVQEQIRIAMGKRLSYQQADIHFHGAAIECRIYAEDPEHRFMPSPGEIKSLRVPGGPGIRDDSGIYEGFEVSIHYDPLLSKLVSWGDTRNEAIRRMERALEEYQILGIKTTIPFYQRVMKNSDFLLGNVTTSFIDEIFSDQDLFRDHPMEELAVIAAAIFQFESFPITPSQPSQNSANPWRLIGRKEGLRS